MMSSQQAENKAAWLLKAGTPFEIKVAPLNKPGPGEILVKNHAVAMNPADFKMQDEGLFIKDFPTIIGCDLAGEVVEIGPNVTEVKVGQRVLGQPAQLLTGKPKDAPFQHYTIVKAQAATQLPDDMTFEAGSSLPLSIGTAAHGLYGKEYLGLGLPSHEPTSTGKTILVWGGSSSVGVATIQLAAASGVEVIATASPHNHELVKNVGAAQVFDYNSPSIEEDLISAFKGKECAGALDGESTNKSADQYLTIRYQRSEPTTLPRL
jgi:NADPH:quinone reductase-like Zn-dependent oxidoreductase